MRVGFIVNEVLMFDMHHIISDCMSMSIIANELNHYYYGKEEELEKLEVQYSDYAYFVKEKDQNKNFEDQISFYKEMFDSDYEELDIPKKSMKEYEISDSITENGKISTQSIAYFVLLISEEISSSINSYIKNKKISKIVFLITLYSYILSKYCGQENVYISLINANRNNHYIENMIGMFVTTQPILLKFDNSEVSFEEILKENMNVLMNVYKNNDLSFSELKQKLNLKSINNTFIFQPKAIVNPLLMKDYPSIFNEEEYQESLSLYENNNSKFDIAFTLIEGENNYSINIIYDNNIYEESIIKGIANSYLEIIQNIKRYDQKIKDIEYISKEERKKILNQFNNNVCKNDCDKVYHVEFSKVAKKNSYKNAIIYNNIKISYQKLNEMSNSLVYYLKMNDIKRGSIIPVISEHSPYYIIAALAILKYGAAFLPIDPEFPKKRIEYMINESKSNFVLQYVSIAELSEKLKFNDIINYKLQHHNYNRNTQEIENINNSEDL
ncbi:CoA-dependent acyltransferase [Neocallimastix californiae]|uniref:CoA-dependent acyltransferase n=1 Tax=Neocallimastix californiae TaxID=1754190 RepID=A0A1Y1XHC1_9FUNG|nr:CoA-dependent acyltransferase [Neocallimastix californiae]|eukprot:ORX85151.1 CoA-dependent acyltransferase [Neocallimastix californiae]